MPESQRKILSEAAILEVACPTCERPAGKTCVTRGPNYRSPLAFEIGATECSFHAGRLMKAQEKYFAQFGLKPLDATDKALILFYAYIALCDSVSAKSEDIFGTEKTSEEIQAYFARKAVEELRHDGLFKNVKAN